MAYTIRHARPIRDKNPDDVKTLSGAEFTAYSVAAPDDEAAPAVSDADGKVDFFGLPKGCYIIRETKAPEGYEKAVPISFVVKADTVGPDENRIFKVTMVDKRIPQKEEGGQTTPDNNAPTDNNNVPPDNNNTPPDNGSVSTDNSSASTVDAGEKTSDREIPIPVWILLVLGAGSVGAGIVGLRRKKKSHNR